MRLTPFRARAYGGAVDRAVQLTLLRHILATAFFVLVVVGTTVVTGVNGVVVALWVAFIIMETPDVVDRAIARGIGETHRRVGPWGRLVAAALTGMSFADYLVVFGRHRRYARAPG